MVSTQANARFSAKTSLDIPEHFEWEKQRESIFKQL